jgi:ribosomal protein S1
MTNKKIILQNKKEIIPLRVKYQDDINLFVTSSEHLVKGTILIITKSEVYLDFGTKAIIKVSKQLYIENLIKLYVILNTSFLLLKRPINNQLFSKFNLIKWLKRKLIIGQKISLKINTINSISNVNTINFKESLRYIKYNKFFHELETVRKSNYSIKGFILNSIKGGYSVAIGSLITFLPIKKLTKKKDKSIYEIYTNSSINFKIFKINFNKKNVIITKA